MNELDALLHQPLRTQLVAFLAGAGEVTFTQLKQTLEVSDGNLESHLKKLIAADYVVVRKDLGLSRPLTYYMLTSTGTLALQNYVQVLQKLLVSDPVSKVNVFEPLASIKGL
ncbi:MAG: transcriptional regulator [Methylophilaceae bacterium]